MIFLYHPAKGEIIGNHLGQIGIDAEILDGKKEQHAGNDQREHNQRAGIIQDKPDPPLGHTGGVISQTVEHGYFPLLVIECPNPLCRPSWKNHQTRPGRPTISSRKRLPRARAMIPSVPRPRSDPIASRLPS